MLEGEGWWKTSSLKLQSGSTTTTVRTITLSLTILLPTPYVKSHCIPALGMMYYSLESSLRDLQVMSEHDPEHEHDHEPSVYTWAQALQDSIVRSLPSKSSERVFSCLNGVAG